ncbi:MAG: aminotransferase class I/II-fold pyridoxal phosphate-dependent enzyme [bacterium]|nr:aminotransferase class I/II-fold pyridoxal phosphate-dependent enzyme [bacterium]
MEPNAFETRAIRMQTERSNHREHSVPIYATSSYVFEDADHARALFAKEVDGNVYSRYSNPNNDEFVQKLCALEGAEAGIATASGMAAMFISLASFVKAGDHIVACRSVFGSTHQILTQLLPRWDISCTYVEGSNLDEWEAAVTPNTKVFFLETPSNPGLQIFDIEAISEIAHRHNILVNVDNCFATPYLQNPIKLGADIVTHSATKFIDGQGRTLGGAVLASKALIDEVMFMNRHTGPAMSPFNGWVLSKSLETLAVRMDRHCENAKSLAEFLSDHPAVSKVHYPFLDSHPQKELAKKQMLKGGGLVTFELAAGLEGGRNFLDHLSMISLSSNLGDSRTIATHPASTTHSKLSEEERLAVGIQPGTIRISAGLEHINDIKKDVEQALNA